MTTLTDHSVGELLSKFPPIASSGLSRNSSLRISLSEWVLYKTTPCPAPEVCETVTPRYLDQPLYVCSGKITRGSNGSETANFFWEKREALLPVL